MASVRSIAMRKGAVIARLNSMIEQVATERGIALSPLRSRPADPQLSQVEQLERVAQVMEMLITPPPIAKRKEKASNG